MQGGKVVGLLDGTALATEAQRAVARGAGREGRRHAPDASNPRSQANERFDHKERQKAKSLGLLVQRSRQREPAAEEEEERRL